MADRNYVGQLAQETQIPKKEIGVDTDVRLLSNISEMVQSGRFDMGRIEAFTHLAQDREQTYELIDMMAEDSTVSAVLETYAEDCTELNDAGNIVWAEASDTNVLNYVNYLLSTLQIDKYIYKWVYRLCKDGDLYLRLFTTDETKGYIYSEDAAHKNVKTLNEQVYLAAGSNDDTLAHYISMVDNPATMFELLKFGKTVGYIEADVGQLTKDDSSLYNYNYNYKASTNDVTIHSPMKFVHASLDQDSSRNPEKLTLFEEGESDGDTYEIRRGKSILHKAYKQWRQLVLLENSVLLNRVTKSSLIRIVNVEVGDMPKEMVRPHIAGIKAMFEQKLAINSGTSINEYTAPGPLENTIYVPTHNGVGTLSTQAVGGDVDVKSLADLDYFKNKFYSAVRIPKQYLGDTDDSTGFNGGTSLSIVSSRYAKEIKKIQNTVLQALTTAINILLLSKGMESYIGNFTLKMVAPTTQEQLDKIDLKNSKISIISDVMNLIGTDIDNKEVRLEIMKTMLSAALEDEDVVSLIQSEIDALSETPEKEISENNYKDSITSDTLDEVSGDELDDASPEPAPVNEISELPSIEDLRIDFTDNTAQ